MENNEFIYGLYFEIDNKKHFFYVGRSGRGENRVPGVRFKEHQYRSKRGKTSVYKFIREVLDDNDVEWKEEILCWCDRDQATTNDTEMFWVIKMLQDKHVLYNEKNGDAEKYVEAQEAAGSGYVFNDPSDVKKYKQSIISEKKAKAIRRLTLEKTKAENDFLTQKVDKKTLLSSLKRVKKSDCVMLVSKEQQLFDEGKYGLALKALNGSYRRFAEMFGVTYHECIG